MFKRVLICALCLASDAECDMWQGDCCAGQIQVLSRSLAVSRVLFVKCNGIITTYDIHKEIRRI